MKKLISCMLLALILTGGMVFAGGNSASSGSGGGGTTTTPVGTYPITTDVTLTYWVPLDANEYANYTSRGDEPIGKALMERTGIKIDFQHPPSTATAEAFNLMIASGDGLPDIIERTWITDYVGGPEKAIGDNIIIKLNDVIDKWSPNLKAYLQAHPDYARMARSDSGNYYAYPFFRDGEKLHYSQGLMIRKDWLDELGLQPPSAIPEWHDVLVAFRDKKGIKGPYTQAWSNNARMFVPSFGVLKNWYIGAEDGKVHYGQIEPGYRRWIETMAQWYKEGLIDPDIISLTTAQLNAKMTNGSAGATVASGGSGMGTWTPAARASNPKYEILALDYPSLTKGEKRVYSIPGQVYTSQGGAAITTACKNVEIAARFLDYGYTQAGHLLYNFGIEGESYTMVNGKPTYTPAILAGGANKWPLAQALTPYVRSTGAGPFAQDEGYIEQYYMLPEQKQLLVNYVVPGAGKYVMPAVTATPEESRELATILNDINTFHDETVARWLVGTDPVNDTTWNNYVNTIKRLNIDRAIAIQTGALDRFNKR
ncbi:sugar ABC transporter permease [Spirochaetia bacterium]|nr:sugar ABC transporter permease [Spirochaetia bacterium]